MPPKGIELPGVRLFVVYKKRAVEFQSCKLFIQLDEVIGDGH